MEKEVIIDTFDGKKIYGILNSPDEKTDKLIVFIHGFTGNCNEHLFFNGAKFFKAKGIASFRFDLYTWRDNGRVFTDCGLADHIKDLRAVFDHFKNKYSKIYLVGHSFGGIIVLQSKLNAASIVLWDSSHPDSPFLSGSDDCKFNKALDAYLLNWGLVYVVGKKMFKDALSCKSAGDLIASNQSSIKIICAGKGELIERGKDYYNLASTPKSFAIIENAGHTFDEEGTEERLFKETFSWILDN